MKRRGFGGAAIAAACLAVAALGCGDDNDSSSDAAGGSGGDKQYSIGIVGFASSDQTSQQAIKGYTDTANAKGWKVTSIDPQGSTDKAVAGMQDLVQKQVDLLVVTVFPSTSLTAGLRAAKAAGIPVISLSGGLADGVQANYDGGYSAGRILAKELVSDTGGKGEILVLGYRSGLPCIGREKALDEALSSTSMKRTRNEVPIPGQVEASTRFTQAWLAKRQATGEGLTVWGCFDDPAVGAISALNQNGRDDVKVYGMNGQPPALKAIQAGDMDATVYLNVYAAGQQMANDTPKYVDAGVDAKPVDVPIPSELVNHDNVDAFLEQNPDALKGL
jgi:ribose transport system substrate-binding protein